MRNMMRMSRGIALLGAVGIASMACGVDAAKTKVTVAMWGDVGQTQMMKEILAGVSKDNPDLSIKLDSVDWGAYHNKLITRFAAGDAPDVVYIDSFFEYGYRNLLADLGPYMKGAGGLKASDYFAGPMAAFRYKDKQLAWPNQYSTSVAFYNVDMFKRAGLVDPNESVSRGEWTWEYLVNVARKMTLTDSNGKTTQWGLDGSIGGEPFPFLFMTGAKILSPDRTTCVIDNKEAVQAFQFLADLWAKYRLLPGGGFLFAAKKTAVAQNWPLYEAYRPTKDLNFDVAPLPAPDGKSFSTVVGGPAWGISRASKHKEGAWRVIRGLVSKDAELTMARHAYGVPAMKSVARSKEYLDPLTRPMHKEVPVEAGETAQPWPYTLNWFRFLDTMAVNLQKAREGKISAADVAARIQREANVVLKASFRK